MKGYDARLLDAPTDFARGVITLAVFDRDRDAYLMAAGTWLQAEPRTVPEGIGIRLPRGSIEAIAAAIQEWQGHASHADTEARVLREWLEVERGRVDAVLARGDHP